MSDRIPKPNTTNYLLRDIPKPVLELAKRVLAAEGLTVKYALLRTLRTIAKRAPRD